MNSIFSTIVIILIGILYGIVFFDVMIPLLQRFKYGQAIRKEGPRSHLTKSGTPTMGGIVMIIITIMLSVTLIIFNLKKEFNILFKLLVVIIPIIGFGLIGFLDDYLIILKKNNEGLSPSIKFLLQLMISAISYYLILKIRGNNLLNFFGVNIDLKFLYGIFIIISYTGFTNGANLTDGIDGLLGGTSLIALVGISYIAFVKKDMFVFYFAISLIIAIISFLIFNLPKAKIFMGDTGSLMIGAVIFALLLLLNMDILIFFFGFTFLIESISVILQVWFFKKTKGNRLFKMSPIHHHLELIGLKDYKVDIIIWTLTFVFVLFGTILGVLVF